MANWSVKSRIIAAFAVVILIMAVLAVFTLARLQAIHDQTTDITSDSMPGLIAISEIESRTQRSITMTLMRDSASDAGKRKQLDDTIEVNRRRIDELMKEYETTIHENEDRQMFATVKHDLPLLLAAERAHLDLSGVVAEESIRQIEGSFERLDSDVAALMAYNKTAAQKDTADVLGEVRTSRLALIVTLLAVVVVAIGSAFFLVRAITRPLNAVIETMELMRKGNFSKRLVLNRNDEFGKLTAGLNQLADDVTSLIRDIQRSGIQINTSATEIAATSREHQATANEIAATTSEIGATSREISATSKELSRTMNNVTAVAERTSGLASSGQTALTRMEATIQQITVAAGSINAKLGVLNEKAANIGSVVTTITKVADQTNLLSLNAAIEAEKAGEYGRGFAVVATEIRRLADQTAVSTHDIEQMVKQMQSAVSAGVMGMEAFAGEVRQAVVVIGQVSDELSQIIEQVQTLTPSFESVNEGMDAQTVAAQQISDALSQLSDSAQQTVDSLRLSNVAIDQLSGVTRVLQTGVSRFALQG